MTTLNNLSGDSRTLSDIDEELSVLKEKIRVTKDKISESGKRLEIGDAMIEKWRDETRTEGKINQTMLALAEKNMAFHKIHTSANDKLFALRKEYSGLQDDYSGLHDEYIALAKCLIPDWA